MLCRYYRPTLGGKPPSPLSPPFTPWPQRHELEGGGEGVCVKGATPCAPHTRWFRSPSESVAAPAGCCTLLPLQVQGALLSMGDAHAAQGDSELDGTAIETSITARVKVTLHKKASLPKLVKVRPAA